MEQTVLVDAGDSPRVQQRLNGNLLVVASCIAMFLYCMEELFPKSLLLCCSMVPAIPEQVPSYVTNSKLSLEANVLNIKVNVYVYAYYNCWLRLSFIPIGLAP